VIIWILSVIAAAATVAAWWIPGSLGCAALGWSSIGLWIVALASPRDRLKRLYVGGVLTYLGGFYWLYGTIKNFGGFPTIAAVAIFALFVCGSAVSFLIWGFVWQHLPKWCSRWGIRTALAWLVATNFWIRIFPWDFGHTQLGFIPLAQIADITGVTGISFLMMWVLEAAILRKAGPLVAKIPPVLLLGSSLLYGIRMEKIVPTLYETPVNTAMIQGNVSLREKHDVKYFSVNRQRYLDFSAGVSQKDLLIIWPESTITDWIPARASDARTVPELPFLADGSAFLVGGLTWASREEFFNSSVLIRPNGSLDTPYHKMILMPFGEYTPFGSVFPWLKDINATAGQFTAGTAPSVLSYELSNGSAVKLSPLICYEDIIPDLARRAAQMGTQLLVNQTNDAWFGDTAAPYQHHMIASFRAIETRRFLLRSTNTGLTAVVDPLGRTLASLLPFSEGILPMEVNLVSSMTWYSTLPIDRAWLLLAVLGALVTIWYALRRSPTRIHL
jgi:apolipoprotein N-acyltransferase